MVSVVIFFLYEGVMELNNRPFTALSMLSEQHDNISISVWLKRWLKCNVKPPKVVISGSIIGVDVRFNTSFHSIYFT